MKQNRDEGARTALAGRRPANCACDPSVHNALNPPPSAHFLSLEGGGGLRGFFRHTKMLPKIGACGGLWKNDLKNSMYTSITNENLLEKKNFQVFHAQTHSHVYSFRQLSNPNFQIDEIEGGIEKGGIDSVMHG